jgi:hypothetical protein
VLRLRPIRRYARHRAVVVSAVAAYTQWRRECAAVGNAYRRWVIAGALDRPLAFDAYTAALDREEGAARLYARLMRRARGLAETGVAQ